MRRTLKEFSKKLRKYLGDELVMLRLFGSYARRQADKNSDIDLLIVLKNRNFKITDDIYRILFELDPYYKYKISLSIFSEKEYNENIRLGSFFIDNIDKEAVAI